MYEDYEPREELPRALLREVYDWVEAGMMAVVCVVLLFTLWCSWQGRIPCSHPAPPTDC